MGKGTFRGGSEFIGTDNIRDFAYDLGTDGTPELTRTLDRSQDNLLRDSGWQLKNGATIENSAAYLYSATDGRLFKVLGLASPGLASPEFAYGYEPNSNLIKTVTGPAHTVTNTWETNRNVLASKGNEVATTNISTYSYGVNPLGQRTNVAQTGSAFDSTRDLTWGYDALGQVTKAQSTIPGLDRAYAFDMIGNRLSGGGLNPPGQTSYTSNALNQYTAIGSLNPVHDDDGNMTSGPLPANVNANSTLVWDGENRLIEAQVGTSGPLVRYLYDAQSRRIAETVGGATKLTIHDGWNPIAEYGSAGFQPASLAKSFIWGVDLSGSMQGAGGIGGLLMVTVGSAGSADRYFPTYDGNGNVSEYLDSVGVVQAHYEYDPFGKTTVATGPKVNDFTHRFSTKPLDATTGLYYYGYRYYDPNTGRWPSRDPIQERGGVNLYGFVGNDGVNAWDKLGLKRVGTGIFRCKDHKIHSWIKYDESNTAGFYPKGGDISNSYGLKPGQVSRPEPLRDDPNATCVEIKLNDCCYNIASFGVFVRSLIDADYANPPVYNAALGGLGTYNCETWIDKIFSEAKEKSKKSDASWWCFLL